MAENKNPSKKINPVVAGAAGVAVGAAVAASAVALSDPKNRKKIEKVVTDIKQQGVKVLETIQKEAQNMKNMISKTKGNTPAKPTLTPKSGTKKSTSNSKKSSK